MTIHDPKLVTKTCLSIVLLVCTFLLSGLVFAQDVSTSTGATSINDVIANANDAYLSFRDGAILAGISGVVTALVSLTRISSIGAWIEKKNLNWIRLALGVVGTGLLSAITLVADGKDTIMVLILSAGAALSSPGLAELVKYLSRVGKSA